MRRFILGLVGALIVTPLLAAIDVPARYFGRFPDSAGGNLRSMTGTFDGRTLVLNSLWLGVTPRKEVHTCENISTSVTACQGQFTLAGQVTPSRTSLEITWKNGKPISISSICG